MNFKKVEAAKSTVTRDVESVEDVTGNIYKSCVIVSKRANQIGLAMKEELTSKLNEFATHTDNLEEVFENREQIEISKFYERVPKPNAIALEQLMNDEIYIRDKKS